MKVQPIFRKAHNVMAVALIIAVIMLMPALIQKISIKILTGRDYEAKILPEQIKAAEGVLNKDIARYDKLLTAKTPKYFYIVINTSANEFSLYKGFNLIKKDKCSTGSYVLLKNGENEEWLFRTPRGEFKIQSKTAFPVWRKPDWAFVEEGLPIPPKTDHTRYEYGVLGDYALGFGHGYLIHGTLYQRFLGLPVTHGCVRLNDENLELVYKSLNEGSKVYIY